GARARAHAYLTRRVAPDGRHREADRSHVPAGDHSGVRAVGSAAATEGGRHRAAEAGAVGPGSRGWAAAAVKPKRASRRGVTQQRHAKASRRDVFARRFCVTSSRDALASLSYWEVVPLLGTGVNLPRPGDALL